MFAWVASVAVLAFIMAATPGPNNVLFAASGTQVGFRRTLPGLGGMLCGFAIILAACTAGIGSLVAQAPRVRVAMMLAASLYMAWLALKLWRAPTLIPGDATQPMLTWGRMAVLQLLNAKTWLACLTFASGYLVGNSPGGPLVNLVGAGVFLLVVLMSASTWTLVGAALRTRLQRRHWRSFNRALSVMAYSTIVMLWIEV